MGGGPGWWEENEGAVEAFFVSWLDETPPKVWYE